MQKSVKIVEEIDKFLSMKILFKPIESKIESDLFGWVENTRVWAFPNYAQDVTAVQNTYSSNKFPQKIQYHLWS